MSVMQMLRNDIQKLTELYQSGLSTNKIAEIYGCNSGLVYSVLKENKVLVKKKQKFEGDISDFEESIKKMYENGNGSHVIGKKLGISKPAVLRVLQKHFDTSRNRDTDPNNLLKDKKDKVVEMYELGMSGNKIAKELGHTGPEVCKLLKKSGFDTSNWKIEVDENFFKNIDSQEKAYVLGWMFSDGNVRDEGKNRIAINNKDIEILHKIKDILGYKGKIHEFDNGMVELCVNRISMTRDLIKYGCVPAKSLILQFPIWMPDELLSHFMRGCYDGDGGIHERKHGIYTSLTSSQDFIEAWSEKLTQLGIEHHIYKKNEDKPTRMLHTSKMESTVKLCQYLYKDATVYLQRKYDNCKQYLNPI